MRLPTFVAIGLTVAMPLGAQTPAARPPGAAPVAEQQAAPEPYTYESEGRRDPFLSLSGTGTEPRDTSSRADGPAGMTIAEIAVRGVMQSRGTLVAMISGADQKTYIVRPGDKLLDGAIKTITPQGMICVQDVNDPLSLVKQREVSKLLHAAEGRE
jgi:Tfp pilus assembly protein PilP